MYSIITWVISHNLLELTVIIISVIYALLSPVCAFYCTNAAPQTFEQPEPQIRGDIEDNSKIIFLISQ